MQLTLTTINSVMMLGFMALMGFIGGKKGVIDETSSNRISKLLVNIFMPMLAIKGYFVPFDSSTLKEILWCYAGSFISGVVGIVVGFIIFRSKNNPKYAEEFCAGCFPNCGVIGIPLITMIVGGNAALYGASYLTINSFFMWVGAPLVMSGKFDINTVKKILVSPVMLSVYTGILIYFLRIPVPSPIQNAITAVGNSVGPLAMMVTGAMISRANLKQIVGSFKVYWISIVRLIIQPLVFLVFVKLLPFVGDTGLACFISFACPTASVIVVLSEMHKLDSTYVASITTMNTILCIITLPLMVTIYSLF